MPGPKSLGKMEVVEPEDKSFSKHMFRDGTGDVTPNEGSTCIVAILLLSENTIDEAELGGYRFGNEPTEITIGEGDTFLANHFDQMVCSMKEGEQAYIKSKLDPKGNKLGELDMKKDAFKFNLTLQSFSRAADRGELEQDELLERAQHQKNKGTELFQKGNLEYAVKRYNRAVECLSAMDNTEINLPDSLLQQFKTLRVQCHLNLAACNLKKEDFRNVIIQCNDALEVDGKSVKGLYRRGQGYVKLGKYDKARADFAKALELEPENKAAAKEVRAVDELIKKEKKMYQNMFQSSGNKEANK